MGAFAVVERRVRIEVVLQLFQRFVERFAESHGVELLLHRAVEAFAEAVGFRRSDVGTPMFDLLDRQVEYFGLNAAKAKATAKEVGKSVSRWKHEAFVMALRKRRLAEWLRLLNTKTFGRALGAR